jgi:hypothetical protein
MGNQPGDTLSIEREVATRLWPQHAEICSEDDWVVISHAAQEDRPLAADIIEPVGEAKDAILASLMILYWTMKIARLAMQIAKEVSGLHGRKKVEAIVAAATDRMDSTTPKVVSDRIHDIVDSLGFDV